MRDEVEIAACWPSVRDNRERALLFESMIGATIIRIGAPIGMDVEGGGLAIEFVARGETGPQIAILAFNELGLWLDASLGHVTAAEVG